jgi:hypothetical protein
MNEVPRIKSYAEWEAEAEEWAKGKTQEQMREEIRRKIEDRMREHAESKMRKKPIEQVLVEFPDRLSDVELWRRQAAIDAAWERTLEARREIESEWAASCHRGPSDPDYPKRRW